MDLEPALHVDSHLQLVFVRSRSMMARTDNNKAATRFGIDAVVVRMKEPGVPRSKRRSLVRSVLLFLSRLFSYIPSPVRGRQPELEQKATAILSM